MTHRTWAPTVPHTHPICGCRWATCPAQVLHNGSFLYDSTILEEPTNSISGGMGARTWPYTLQDGIPQNCAWRVAAAPRPCWRRLCPALKCLALVHVPLAPASASRLQRSSPMAC